MEIGTAVMLTVEKGVLTYNGLECDAMESAYVTIPENVADPITAFWYEGTATLVVGETLNIMDGLSVSGSEGTITFKSQDESIVTVDENGVIKVQVTDKNGIVRVSVFNSGKPIPEDELENIWVKFYKIDKARTREYGGSGIGLSIVKAIMDNHDKECGVINHEDSVEFWFELDANK